MAKRIPTHALKVIVDLFPSAPIVATRPTHSSAVLTRTTNFLVLGEKLGKPAVVLVEVVLEDGRIIVIVFHLHLFTMLTMKVL